MTTPLARPPRKDPLARTRVPLLPPAARSRTALGLTRAAAEGRFALQVCNDCGQATYPPRDACPRCLSAALAFRDVPVGGAVLAATVIRTATDPYFRQRLPWRIATVVLDCGPVLLAHLHCDVAPGDRVRMTLRLDPGGQAVLLAMPQEDTANMHDDPQLRTLTCDPKFRRALVSDGRGPVGAAVARALVSAGASTVVVGIADPWKPWPEEAALRALAGVEIVPLDLTDSRSVADAAAQFGGRVDILVNTALHLRPGGVTGRPGLGVAREEMEARYFGLLRLAQGFGPAMRARGADGTISACAFVNLISVFALMSWPEYGASSAAEAACLSAAQCLRAELRPGGVRVLTLFHGPLDIDWQLEVPPPKVTPEALARAVVRALREGIEDSYVGDIAEDVRARLAANPKALERELSR